MVLKGLLKIYYDLSKAYIKEGRVDLENKIKRQKLEVKHLREFARYSLSTTSDEARELDTTKRLELNKKELKEILVAEKNLGKKSLVDDFQKLNNHAFVEKVLVEGDCINIYTKKLKFRNEYNIGNYLIRINLDINDRFINIVSRIRIENLERRVTMGESSTYYDHWFVANTKPCLDQWRKVFENYLLKGNLFLAGSNLIQFLLSEGTSGHVNVNRWINLFNRNGDYKDSILANDSDVPNARGATEVTITDRWYGGDTAALAADEIPW